MTDPATVKVIKEEVEVSQETVYDDAFTVKKQRWGTFVSHDLDGGALITSMDEQGCIAATRWYLKAKQEGFTEEVTQYDGTVGGKL